MLKEMPLIVIKDRRNRLSILGCANTEQPDPAWLAIQSKPFAKDALFYKAYPFSGGAILVDLNNIEVIRKVTQADIDLSANNAKDYNPARLMILTLWESPPLLPEFILAQLPCL